MSDTKLYRAIREHYDGLLGLYESLWGEHIHHGYWDPGRTPGSDGDRREAQERTVRELIAFAGLPRGGRVLDAGCGVGAPAILLASALGCRVDGITLSAAQVVRATEKAAEAGAGVAERTRFRQLDAQHTDYADGAFDGVWALESLELMPDKLGFLAETRRVLRPGGTLGLTTWCVRDDRITPAEERLLERIRHDFAIPSMLPLVRYEDMCGRLGYADVHTADWTDRVRATWDVDPELVQRLVGDRRHMLDLARSNGVAILRLIHVVPLMKQAYECGVLRYGALRAVASPT